MIYRKRTTLFPILFNIRHYGLTYRLIGNCCELNHYCLRFILLVNFIFKEQYTWRCPQCGKLHSVTLQWHTAPYFDDRIRELNKLLDEE